MADSGGIGVSIGGRQRNPLEGVVAWMILTPLAFAFGAMICAAAFALHYFNELSDAVRAGSLERGALVATTVSADRVDPAREGQLVHVTGQAVARAEVVDPDTGVSAPGVQLVRAVQMFQWVERRQEVVETDEQGREQRVVRYTYEPLWLQSWRDPGEFKGPQPPRNPSAMPYRTEQWLADHVTVGAFRLTPLQVLRIGSREDLDLSRFEPERRVAAGTLVRHGNEYYLGRDPARPQIGDMRISYAFMRPGPVSILAAQSGSGFAPYQVSVRLPAARSLVKFLSPGSSQIDELRDGTVSKEAMVDGAQRNRVLLTWALRVAGAMVMVLGLQLMLWPCLRLLGVMPTVRRFFEQGRGFVALRLGVGLSVILCAFLWVAGRGLADPTVAQHVATAAVLLFLGWVASGPLRGARRARGKRFVAARWAVTQ